MDPLAIGALLVALAALVFTAINTRRGAQQSYVQELHERVELLRTDLDACKAAREQNRREIDSNYADVSRLNRQVQELLMELHDLHNKVNGGPR